MERRENIRDFYGRIIGYITTDTVTGNAVARDFYGRILGNYDKKLNVTRDFYGRIVAQGNTTSALIWENESKLQNEKNKNK